MKRYIWLVLVLLPSVCLCQFGDGSGLELNANNRYLLWGDYFVRAYVDTPMVILYNDGSQNGVVKTIANDSDELLLFHSGTYGIVDADGNLMLKEDGNIGLIIGYDIYTYKGFRPVSDNAYPCGAYNYRWSEDNVVLFFAVNYNTLTDTSTVSDAYGAVSTNLYAYTNGLEIKFQAGVANDGAATFQLNSLGAKDLRKNVDDALVTGDIIQNQWIVAIYDDTNGWFQITSHLAQ